MRSGGVAVLFFILVGCGSLLPTTPAIPSTRNPSLHMSNATPLTVSVVVNGHVLGAFPPGGQDQVVSTLTLGPPPWTVQARSASGRVLTSFAVRATDVQPGNGLGQVLDLTCGRFWLWVGDAKPDAPVPPSPGVPGDCAPYV